MIRHTRTLLLTQTGGTGCTTGPTNTVEGNPKRSGGAAVAYLTRRSGYLTPTNGLLERAVLQATQAARTFDSSNARDASTDIGTTCSATVAAPPHTQQQYPSRNNTRRRKRCQRADEYTLVSNPAAIGSNVTGWSITHATHGPNPATP